MSETLVMKAVRRGLRGDPDRCELKLHGDGDDYGKLPLGSKCLVTPLEDESLPHPGDGKEWEWKSGRVLRGGSTWDAVEIVTAPHPWNDDTRAVTVLCADGDYCLALLSDLRERQPEPEHRPWCAQRKHANAMYACTCERRSGEERRNLIRRGYDISEGRRQEFGDSVGRRSGIDRRSS